MPQGYFAYELGAADQAPISERQKITLLFWAIFLRHPLNHRKVDLGRCPIVEGVLKGSFSGFLAPRLVRFLQARL
jgi:hypothetical protein